MCYRIAWSGQRSAMCRISYVISTIQFRRPQIDRERREERGVPPPHRAHVTLPIKNNRVMPVATTTSLHSRNFVKFESEQRKYVASGKLWELWRVWVYHRHVHVSLELGLRQHRILHCSWCNLCLLCRACVGRTVVCEVPRSGIQTPSVDGADS